MNEDHERAAAVAWPDYEPHEKIGGVIERVSSKDAWAIVQAQRHAFISGFVAALAKKGKA